MEKILLRAVLFATTICLCTSNCPREVLTPMQFSLEFGIWRGWHQAIIFTPDMNPGCQWAITKFIKCLSVNGIAAVTNSTSTSKIYTRLGIFVFASSLRSNPTSITNLINELHRLQMNTASYDWLITTTSDLEFSHLNKILNGTAIRFDQNIVVAYPRYKSNNLNFGLCDNNFKYKKNRDVKNVYIRRNNCFSYRNQSNCLSKESNYKTKYESSYYRTTERLKNLTKNNTYKRFGQIWKLFRSGVSSYNISRRFEMYNVSQFSLQQQFKKWLRSNNHSQRSEVPRLLLVQYFKVRHNSTLYARFMGVWDRDNSMSEVDIPYPVEARNFLGEVLIVGRCNSTGDGSQTLEDDGPSAPASIDNVLNFFTVRLNATLENRYYSKLGLRTYEGTWTGLLGALIVNNVDIALEPVTARNVRYYDMDFIFPIAKTMSNIYIRQQETSTVRDIFLAPFSARLVACVMAVAITAAIAVVIISRISPNPGDLRQIGYTEGLIWSTGILCQQGGTWTPPNPSASVLLIVCLLFAVVTYNAYAAFITSVLSVRVASVDNVAAVLRSPTFKIGYIKNGADQMYLMSTKDVQLNAFYIRGYSDSENLVSSAEEGLTRAASQDYAFFAGQRAARSTLRTMSQARGRCAIREVPVHSTRAQLALPLPRRSPYARPILVSLLQIRSGGSLARLEAALVPEMPQCAAPAGFASARAVDVQSALLLLAVGYIAALLLGVIEFCWKNRREQKIFFKKMCSRILNTQN